MKRGVATPSPQAHSDRVPHVRTSVRGLTKTGQSPIGANLRVPKGRLRIAQDGSPGVNMRQLRSPVGTAEHRSTGFQPSLTGLDLCIRLTQDLRPGLFS